MALVEWRKPEYKHNYHTALQMRLSQPSVHNCIGTASKGPTRKKAMMQFLGNSSIFRVSKLYHKKGLTDYTTRTRKLKNTEQIDN